LPALGGRGSVARVAHEPSVESGVSSQESLLFILMQCDCGAENGWNAVDAVRCL
jgi:hypothetical protein